MKNFSFILLLLLGVGVSAQVPVFNSYPEARPVIFLDFDGHYVTGTNWNVFGPIDCAPSNLNEQQITEVFNRVAEDYRPFNINITTDSTRYHSAPVKQRMRVILTITNEWYGSRAGGTAYVNSFTWGATPCFIFTKLFSYNVKNISEAAAHEAGHTLGLRHQAVYDTNCVKISDYNTGVGSGETAWAPIMGVGYYRNQTTWHNGPMPSGCKTAQDDLAIITNSTNGFGYRPDVVSSLSSPLLLSVQQNTINTSGLISTTTDADVYTFRMEQSALLQMQVTPYSIAPGDQGSNLDVEVKLYDQTRQLIQTYNPTQTLSAAIDTVLGAGDYFLSVTGVGNQYAADYASLGSYSISGSISDPQPLPLRKLLLRGKVAQNSHLLSWEIDADEKVVKQVLEKAAATGAFTHLAQPAPGDRMYRAASTQSGIAQYRVRVTFDNGKEHYSNTIALKNNRSDKPQLHSNNISGSVILVTSAAHCQYAISDVSGRIIAGGKISQGTNTIYTGHLAAGIYMIRFTNESGSFVEKFTRQ